jgi:DNA ligase-1
MKPMKPMLAYQKQIPDLAALRFPLLVSPKLDGVRAIKVANRLMSRNLKEIPNKFIQKAFETIPSGIDGELVFGDPTDDPYRATVSAVMSEDGEPDVTYYIFDACNLTDPFTFRFELVKTLGGLAMMAGLNVRVVPHVWVYDVEDLLKAEEEFVSQGYEGLMIRDPNGPYKFGRSTLKEGYLLKLKRFYDSEALVIGLYEKLHNTNEAKKNALGRTERSTCKAGMVGAGVLGGFDVRGLKGDFAGVEFKIGGKFKAAERKKFWKERESLIGKIAKYKYFPVGSKDKPRFPIFLGWRDPIDL